MSSYSIDVHLYMEKGMYSRLVQRAEELGVPLSAVVRDAVVKYFADIPEEPDPSHNMPQPEDPIWQLPSLSEAFGSLGLPSGQTQGNTGRSQS
ncbi:MAG TPA: hypothetical protein VM409_08345 [Chloroflexia bacterium]|nr:hypothetical protein [Chloroflexia bacterium]